MRFGRLLMATLVVLDLQATIGAASAQSELNALVWCDHTDRAFLEPFEERFDVKVNTKEYEGTGTALSLLDQSQPGDWDVFVVDSVDVPRVVERGLLAPLPEAELPWADIFPQLRQPDLHFKDGVMYAAPEKFGYNTIAYNRTKVDPADMRRADVFLDPKYKGRIAIYDYYIPMIGMAAISLGMEPSQVTADNLPAIRDRLFAMKENAALIGDVTTVQTALTTGQVDIIAGGGEYVTAGLAAESPDLDWVLPDAGGVRWMQAIGVFAQSEKKPLATEFVKYVLSPEGQARLATSSCYWAMPANAEAGLDAAQKQVLRWDEQPAFIARSHPYFIPDLDLDAKMLDVWQQVLQH